MGFGVWGLGIGVWGLGFGVWGFGLGFGEFILLRAVTKALSIGRIPSPTLCNPRARTSEPSMQGRGPH